MIKERLLSMSEKMWMPFVLVFIFAPLIGNFILPFLGFVVVLIGFYLLFKHRHFSLYLRIPIYTIFSFVALFVLGGTDPQFVDDHDIYVIHIDKNVELEDEQVIIEAETNLEDGTLVSYEVENVDNNDDWIQGHMTVEDGVFHGEVDISNFENGEISAWIGVLMSNQNEQIIEIYGGSTGNNLGGDLSPDVAGKVYSQEVKLK